MKYSDKNLFFSGTKNLYNPEEYVHRETEARAVRECGMKKQFLSAEDEETAFLIRNRDLVDPSLKKVGSDGQLGRFVG